MASQNRSSSFNWSTPVWSPRCSPSFPPSPGTWPPASSRPSHTLAQPHRGLSGTCQTNTSPNISFWSVHQKIISYVVQVESWAIIETKEARLAKRCEIDILLKPQANTLAVLFQAHQPLQVSALSPPAKCSKVLFLPPIAMKEKPTSPRSQRSLPQPDITLCSQFTIISENRIHVNNQRLHEDCLILLNCIRTGR